MRIKDTVWSLDIGPDDGVYRIYRENGSKQRVVYFWLQYLDLIPEELQTCGPDVITELSKLVDWKDTWKTLTISKDASGIRTQANVFRPHSLPRRQLQGDETRVTLVEANGEKCALKIAPFGWEVAATLREVRAYEALMRYGLTLVPRLLGYVYEETTDRVIGFVLEAISGSHPSIKDLDLCREALQQLHSLHIVHGDINRHNILVTGEGVKFIDLEASDIDSKDTAIMDKEMQDLEAQLLGESDGSGRPW